MDTRLLNPENATETAESKAAKAGTIVASSVKNAGTLVATGSVELAQDLKDGSIYIAKGTGFFAKQFASVVADFGRGLKRGWEKS